MFSRLYKEHGKATSVVQPSRCRPFTRAPARPDTFRPKCVRSNDQCIKSSPAANPAPGQPSATNAPTPPDDPNRRALLLRCAALCALVPAAGTSLFSRPAAAALVDEDVATAVFDAVSPSVASIAVVRPVGGVPGVRDVIGSGVVWDAVGPHVLTNFHVVPPLNGSSTVLEVTVRDATTGAYVTLPARVAGTDSLHDLAVLRLLPPSPPSSSSSPASASPRQQLAGGESGGGGGDGDGGGASESAGGAPGLPVVVTPIRVAAAGDLRVGQLVYALGCVATDPAAPTRSLAAGLVSGLGRSIPSPVGARIYGVVQTEARINAANSGGPLVDSFGRLVGLSTAVGAAASNTGRGSGVSFALPVEMLLDLVPKIIVYGNPYGKK